MRALVHDGFGVGFPEGWTDRTTVVLTGPASAGFSPTLVASARPLEGPTTATPFARSQLERIEATLGGPRFEVLSERPFDLSRLHAPLDPDSSAHQLLFRCYLKEGDLYVTQFHLYLIHRGKLYVVVATERVEAFDSTWPIFEEAILGLTIGA